MGAFGGSIMGEHGLPERQPVLPGHRREHRPEAHLEATVAAQAGWSGVLGAPGAFVGGQGDVGRREPTSGQLGRVRRAARTGPEVSNSELRGATEAQQCCPPGHSVPS